jgi:hypothetical protein
MKYQVNARYISFTEIEKYERRRRQSESSSQGSRYEVSLLLASHALDAKPYVVLSHLRSGPVICFDLDPE